jgi:SNF2 family DNA or RNA helicase
VSSENPALQQSALTLQSPQFASWNPRSYQKAGVLKMLGQACFGLLFKPGLGKTTVVYMAIRILQEKGFVKKVLVIAPIKPMYNVWPSQQKKYAEFKHLRVAVLHGANKEELLNSDDYDIYVVNPEGLEWLTGTTWEKHTKSNGKPARRPKPFEGRLKWLSDKFQMLVVDESTEFRYSDTNRFAMLKLLIPRMRRRYIMTGTPMPKTLMDLFGQIYILDEGDALGRFITHYRVNFFYPSPFQQYTWLPQPQAEERITAKIAPQVLVVEHKGNVELPELMFNDIWVELPKDARKRYDEMQRDLISLVQAGAVVAANAAVASSKCRQIANGAVYASDEAGAYTEIHSEKLEALRGLLAELQGDPLLITYEFLFDSVRIKEELKVPSISTGRAKQDNDTISAFQRGELIAAMGHPKSISLGIDGLQDNCANIAMFGVTWNMLHYEQVIDRVRRSGNQRKSVIVHRILARNTVDERAIEVLDSRDKAQRDFMAALRKLG